MLNPLVTIVMFVLIHVDLEMLWEPTSTEDIALLNKKKVKTNKFIWAYWIISDESANTVQFNVKFFYYWLINTNFNQHNNIFGKTEIFSFFCWTNQGVRTSVRMNIRIDSNIKIFSSEYWYSYLIYCNFQSRILFEYLNIFVQILVYKNHLKYLN